MGLAAAVFGVLVGALSAAFLQVVDLGQHFLWKAGWSDFTYAPLLICISGGILIGLCQRYLGDHPKNIQAATQELAESGRLEYIYLPHGLLTAGASLIFGAGLGPEAAIMDLLGGLSTWAADRLRNLRCRLGLPALSPKSERKHRLFQQWPNVIALVLTFIFFYLGVRELYSGSFLVMSEKFAWADLLWSVPLGLLGALSGRFYFLLQTMGQKVLKPLHSHPVLLAVLSGAALGAAASWLPMMLFSGQHDLQAVYLQAAQLGAGMLLLIALTRLFLVTLLLNSGWKGGQFMPLMFSSAALGLAISQLFPFISAPAGILAVMAGLLSVALPKPIVALVLMAMMFPLQYVGISVVAVLAAVVSEKLIWQRRQAVDKTVRENAVLAR